MPDAGAGTPPGRSAGGPTEAFVLLAGGESRRMGTDKAFLEVGGREMLDRALTVGAASVGAVVLSANDPAPYARAVARYGWRPDGAPLRFRRDGATLRLVADGHPRRGPLAGLLAGLRAVDAARCFVAACDLPFLPAWLVTTLLAELERDGEAEGYAPAAAADRGSTAARAAVPQVDGRLQPLGAAYGSAVAAVADRCLAEGRLSLSGFLRRLEVRVVTDERLERRRGRPGAARRWFHNVNRPGDLEEAHRLASSSPEAASPERSDSRRQST